MLTGTEMELRTLVSNYREEFNELPPEDISFPRGANEYDKYIKQEKHVPIHVKGSILFNGMLDKHNITTIEKITGGTKVKFSYLKEPNPYKQNVISFVGGIPTEFDIVRWLDYDVQFEKAFLKPLEGILTPIGWDWETKSSLDSFF